MERELSPNEALVPPVGLVEVAVAVEEAPGHHLREVPLRVHPRIPQPRRLHHPVHQRLPLAVLQLQKRDGEVCCGL